MTCRICFADNGNCFVAQDARHSKFEYWECSVCGCLSLQNPPFDWSAYYPPDYYSLRNEVKNRLTTRIADYFRVTHTPVASDLIRRCRTDWTMISIAPLRRSDKLLDVGSGAGQIVYRLQQLGFDALGIDPFVNSDIYDDDGRLRVCKCALADCPGMYDVILLSHSLEHMVDPEEVLKEIRRHLRPGGRAIIRIPLALEDWRINRDRWHELDPPRHLFLHTPESLAIIAARASLRIVHTRFDSPNKELNRLKQGERASFTLQAH